MKKIHSLFYVLVLTAASVVGCKQKAIQTEDLVIFETGYESISIEPVKPTGGTISKPTINNDNATVFGYYSDPLFQNVFDFNKPVSSGLTIYIKMLLGNGSESNPYQVESGSSLLALSYLKEDTNAHVSVTKDFSTHIQYNEDYEATTFNGVLNGNGHVIDILEDEKYPANTGLLYKIGENGLVKDLVIRGNIEGVRSSTGALCNYNYGVIDNIETVGTTYHATNGCNNGVSLMTTYEEDSSEVVNDFGTVGILSTLQKGGAGGISGTNYGTIRNSMNKMMVKATIGAGSMAGINHGLIENCFNRGAIGTTGNYSVNSSQIRDPNFDFSYIGGIAGANYGIIHQCVNGNQVFAARLPWLFNNAPAGQSDFSNRIRSGGIAGYNYGTYDGNTCTGGIITECMNVGRVHADMQVGGIAGYSNGYISDCFSSGYLGGRSSKRRNCGTHTCVAIIPHVISINHRVNLIECCGRHNCGCGN